MPKCNLLKKNPEEEERRKLNDLFRSAVNKKAGELNVRSKSAIATRAKLTVRTFSDKFDDCPEKFSLEDVRKMVKAFDISSAEAGEFLGCKK